MSRFARHRRVFFIEEAVYEPRPEPELRVQVCSKTGVIVATPLLREGTDPDESQKAAAKLIRRLFREKKIQEHVAWFYTPMALEYSKGLRPKAVVYDCMDELSLFRNAPPALIENETKLMALSDLVFTGGISLFEAKRKLHPSVYPFPSSVDCEHFAQARALDDIAEGQKHIPRPRLGYAGVIDERIDLDLIGEIARRRPDWQIIMIGPVVKIDAATLPNDPNIHWLGMKSYSDLPVYLAGWDVALMPFAINESTRFISPTKTPEYLAAGLPVVSTPIRDVERQYGELGLVQIEGTADGFLAAVEQALTYDMGLKWRARADAFLRNLSWDRTWSEMNGMIEEVLASKQSGKDVRATAMAVSPVS
jgi:glycosyltransferase involved in cell wall biosynthesis